MLISQVCSLASLTSPAMQKWADRLRPIWDADGTDPKPRLVHRKMWEWLFIAEALRERGMLAPGRRGLGFGVGHEPLVALFASFGCHLVATDLDTAGARTAGWIGSAEYAGGTEGLNDHGLCPPDAFDECVEFRFADMNRIPEDLRGFDFTWSSCAFEHLGTLRDGIDFVVEQMRCVRPGGVALHTTELNLSSDDQTIEAGPTVLYRRSDLRALGRRLRQEGFRVRLDLREGGAPQDRHVDVPPYSDIHLRTMLGDFVTTSYGLIIERPTHPAIQRAARLAHAARLPRFLAGRPDGGRSTTACASPLPRSGRREILGIAT